MFPPETGGKYTTASLARVKKAEYPVIAAAIMRESLMAEGENQLAITLGGGNSALAKAEHAALVGLRGDLCRRFQKGEEGYAASADLRDAQRRDGFVDVALDLAPAQSRERIEQDLRKPRGRRSAGEHLRRQTGLAGVKAGLIFEALGKDALADVPRLAATIKSLPLRLQSPRPVAEAISTAGGVRLEALDAQLMVRNLPGVFCAGEMLDWEAPTGGYLLTASMASGLIAGRGAAHWLLRS